MRKTFHSTKEIGLKITITSIILFVLGLSSLGILSYSSSEKALKESIIQSIMKRAADNSDLVSLELKALKKNVEGVGFWLGQNEADWENVKPLLAGEASRLEVERFQVVDMKGFARSTNGNTADLWDRDHFRRALNGETTITNPIVSRLSGGIVLVCATPIIGPKQRIKGVLTAALDPEYLFHMIENRKVGNSGYGFMLNNEGVIIAHPNKKLQMFQLSALDEVKDSVEYNVILDIENSMVRGETGYRYYTFSGVEKIMAYAPIKDTGWSLALTVPTSEVFIDLGIIKQRFFNLTLTAIIISSILLFFIFQYISQTKRNIVIQENADENARLLKNSIEQDQIKTEFFANMSHELRTPVNIILGTLQLLDLHLRSDKEIDKDKLFQRVRNMKQSCRRLIRLVNNIIDTTRIEAGFYEIHPSSNDIVEITREVTLLAADLVKGKGLELQFKSDVSEKYVLCDAGKIERVLLNLLSNAVKFSEQNGRVTINLHDKGESVEISVADTGIGIPEDKLQIIFERFRQVDRSFTRSYEGSGIGLSLVKSLVEMHHGNIYVYSELGKGSRFIVELPTMPNLKADEDTELINVYTRKNNDLRDQVNVELSDINL
jgi:signal transduction histidine kinase